MKKAILLAMFALNACGPNKAAVKVAPTCPDELVQQRNADVRNADIIVAGRWKPAEPDPAPGVGVEIGTIIVSKTIAGELPPDSLVAIVTSEIADPAGKLVQCALSAPSPTEDRIYYIRRGENSLRIIDHRSNHHGQAAR
jgi:hypothetical protein